MATNALGQLRQLRSRFRHINCTSEERADYSAAYLHRTDVKWAKAVADAFENAPHAPCDPAVSRAYYALCDETRAQWELLLVSGFILEPWLKEGQPYACSEEMRRDVLRNRHLHFFVTAHGHGESSDGLDQRNNPLLQDSGIVIHDVKLVFNDLFRAVHDIFGHAIGGFSFGPIGEENAFRCHRRMFSRVALPALVTETRGQNSWFNFGRHLRRPSGAMRRKGDIGYLDAADRPYAQQKATFLPNWCQSVPSARDVCMPNPPQPLFAVVLE